MQYVKIGLPTWKKIERIIREVDRLGFANSSKNMNGNLETVLIRNDTGLSCDRFHILRISGVVITPEESLQDFQQRSVFIASIPSESSQTDGRIVICAEPIAPGEIGRAWADGVVTTRLQVTDTSYGYATAKPDDHTKLISTTQGLFCILYKQSGLGLKWAVLRYGGGSGGNVRWAFLKEETTSTSWTGYLDKNLTGELITIRFTLTGGATSTANGHYTLTAGLPIPVMQLDDKWRCLFPLQGVDECTPTE